MRITLCSFALFAALFLSAQQSFAQNLDPTQAAARRTLLDTAQAALARGDHAAALDAAERAMRLQPTTSVRLFVAQEQQALQQFARAYSNAQLCRSEAQADQALRNRDAILAECTSLQENLRTRIALLTLHINNLPEHAVVRVNDRELPRELWSTPLPVEAGNCRIEARNNEQTVYSRSIRLVGGTSPELTIAPTEHGDARTTHRGPGPIPWIIAGVGGAALVTGAVLYGVSFSTVAECNARGCDTRRADELDAQAATLAWAGIGTMIAGSAAVTAGVVWGLVARPTARRDDEEEEHSAAPSAQPVFYANGMGLRLRF